MVENKDAANVFAEHIAKVTYKDLPKDAIDVARKSILDTIGVMWGASGMAPGVKNLVKVMDELGGNPQATIIGFGKKTAVHNAALTNGAMGHCLDYDDLHHATRVHPSTSLMPAALATAEYKKKSGKDLITAVAVAADTSTRIGLAVKWRLPWHMSPLTGHFSATAASGKLLGLTPDQIADAFGIALCQAAGSMELRWGVGSDIGGMYAAFPAKAGVISALMAGNNISGIKNAFEAKAGFFNLYFEGQYNRDILFADLGKRFEGVNTGFKPWPACAHTHPHIEACLTLMKDNNIKASDIAGMVAYVGDYTKYLCEPIEGRRKPQTTLDAKFSIPFTVAVAATKGTVKLEHYTAQGLKDPEVLAMSAKIDYKLDPKNNLSMAIPPGGLDITTKAGKTFHLDVVHPYGHPEKPLTQELLLNKFRDCARYAINPPPAERVEKAIKMLVDLENVGNVADILSLIH